MTTQHRGYLINTSAQVMVGNSFRGGFTITPNQKSQPDVDGPIELDCVHATAAEAHARAEEAAKSTIDNLLVLKAYQVGDNDIVAAYSPVGALQVLVEHTGDSDAVALDEVVLIEGAKLDMPSIDEDNNAHPSIREELAKLTGPAYLFGWD